MMILNKGSYYLLYGLLLYLPKNLIIFMLFIKPQMIVKSNYEYIIQLNSSHVSYEKKTIYWSTVNINI